MYTPGKLNISVDQLYKLKNAINQPKALSIKVDKLGDKHVFLLDSTIEKSEVDCNM